MATALAEDADAIGLSVLSGAHMTLFRRVVDLLAEAEAADIVVFGGGIIPEADRASLAEIGVAQVFTPGATMAEIVQWVSSHVRGRALSCLASRAPARLDVRRIPPGCGPAGGLRPFDRAPGGRRG